MIYNVYTLINEVNKRRKGKRGGIMEGWRGRRQEWELNLLKPVKRMK